MVMTSAAGKGASAKKSSASKRTRPPPRPHRATSAVAAPLSTGRSALTQRMWGCAAATAQLSVPAEPPMSRSVAWLEKSNFDANATNVAVKGCF